MAVLAVLISVLCLLPLARGQCETMTSPLREFCPFYNYTSLDEANQVQAAAFIEHFKPLFVSNCSTLSNIFICASYSPFCQPPNHCLLPHRELCFYVYSSCIHVFSSSCLPWPSCLNCSLLPSPPKLCLSPILPPPHSVSTPAPSSTSVQPSHQTRFSVFPTATATTTAATAIVTTPSPSSSSWHLILGLSLSLIGLVLLLPLCLLYARRHLRPRHPPPPPPHQVKTAFGPTSAPLPLPPPLPTQSTCPPSSPPNLPECPPPPLPPQKSNVEYQNIQIYSVIANWMYFKFSTISLTFSKTRFTFR